MCNVITFDTLLAHKSKYVYRALKWHVHAIALEDRKIAEDLATWRHQHGR